MTLGTTLVHILTGTKAEVVAIEPDGGLITLRFVGFAVEFRRSKRHVRKYYKLLGEAP